MSTSHLKLKEKYKKEIAPQLMEKFAIKNIMATPKISKVVINVGLGRRLLSLDSGKSKEEALKNIKADLVAISGQYPIETKAKKSIAAFKSRAGMTIGLKTTLRGKRMYDFLDRLINYAIPRVRDFRGLELKNVDKIGNLNVGIKEMTIFPEVPPTSMSHLFGLQITIVPQSKSRAQAIELFRLMNVPLKKEGNK